MENSEKLATRKTNPKHTTIWVVQHYRQTNTNNLNKILALQQTTGGKDEPNVAFMPKQIIGQQQNKKR